MFCSLLLRALKRHIMVLSLIFVIQSCEVALFLIQLIQQYNQHLLFMQKHEHIQTKLENRPMPPKLNTNNKALEKYTTYVLKRLQKILTKSIQRQFLGSLRTHVYNILKQSNRPLWKYHKLFTKSNPTQQQLMFKQFLNHCATNIQSLFKMFIKRRQFKTSVRIRDNLKKWLVAKKVRAVYNCKKIKQIRKRFCENDRALQIAIEKGKPFGNLMKQNNHLTQMFNQQYEFLYDKGGWIYEERDQKAIPPFIKLKQNKFYTDQRPINPVNKKSDIKSQQIEMAKNESSLVIDPMPNQSLAVSEYYSKLPEKQGNSNRQTSNNSTVAQDQRPIKSTGAYNFDIKQTQSKSRSKQKISKPNLDENDQKQQDPPHKQPKHKRLVRKQVYDAKKSIASQIRQKKQLLKTQPNQEPKKAKQEKQPQQAVPQKEQILTKETSLQKTPPVAKKFLKQGLKNMRERNTRKTQRVENKSVQNISALKQTKSRVDCWNKPSIDPKKKKQIEEVYYEDADDIDSYNIQNFKDIPRDRLKQRIARQINKINENIKHLKIRKQRKYSREDPDISVLEKVYEDQYSRRYMQLKPKLNKLQQQRNKAKFRSIPYLLNESQYAMIASNSVSTEQYYEMEKEIIINYERLKKM